MADHRTIENGEFIICERSYESGLPCGGGWINREEREISRHYQKHHDGERVPYERCAIITEAAALALVGQAKLDVAKRKNDGRVERRPKAPRYLNWMPANVAAAGAAGAAAPVTTPAADAKNNEPDVYTPHFDPRIAAIQAALNRRLESRQEVVRPNEVNDKKALPAPLPAPIPQFGNWEVEPGLVPFFPEDEDEDEGSDAEPDSPLKRSCATTDPRFAPFLLTGYKAIVHGFRVGERADVLDSDDAEVANRCYVCNKFLFSFRIMDVHYSTHHRQERDAIIADVYRTWWRVKLLAWNLEVDDSEGVELADNQFACYQCDLSFDNVDAVDAHFTAHHRLERKTMLLRLFEEKLETAEERDSEDEDEDEGEDEDEEKEEDEGSSQAGTLVGEDASVYDQSDVNIAENVAESQTVTEEERSVVASKKRSRDVMNDADASADDDTEGVERAKRGRFER